MVIRDEIKKLLSVIKVGEITPTFLADHPIVALEELKLIANTENAGKPFILLLLDIDQSRQGAFITANLNFVIGAVTRKEYSTDERYANNFNPLIYPIYEQLIECFKNGNSVILGNQNLSVKDPDRVLWGKKGLYGNVGNIFNDYIDAKEVNDLEIKLKIKNC